MGVRIEANISFARESRSLRWIFGDAGTRSCPAHSQFLTFTLASRSSWSNNSS